MKKSLYFALALAVAITGYAIWPKGDSNEMENLEPVMVEGVDFSDELVLETVKYDKKSKVLSYELKNNSAETLEYGFSFTLMKLQEDRTLKETGLTDDLAFIMMLASVEPGKNVSDEIHFELITKTIEPGRYYVMRQYAGTEGKVHIPEVSFQVTSDGIVPIN